jgi:hypothetical protein
MEADFWTVFVPGRLAEIKEMEKNEMAEELNSNSRSVPGMGVMGAVAFCLFSFVRNCGIETIYPKQTIYA